MPTKKRIFRLWCLREEIPINVVVEFVIKLSSEVRFNLSDITFNSDLNLSRSEDRIGTSADQVNDQTMIVDDVLDDRISRYSIRTWRG